MIHDCPHCNQAIKVVDPVNYCPGCGTRLYWLCDAETGELFAEPWYAATNQRPQSFWPAVAKGVGVAFAVVFALIVFFSLIKRMGG